MTKDEIIKLSQTVIYHYSQVQDLHDALPTEKQNAGSITEVLRYCAERAMSVYSLIDVIKQKIKTDMNNGKGILLDGVILNIFPAEVFVNFEKRVMWLQGYSDTWAVEFQQGDCNRLDCFRSRGS